MTELSSLDQKINQVFAGCVVRKDLVKEIRGNAIVPSYVLEYLLGQYCTTSDEDSIQSGIQSVKEILSQHYVHKNEAELVRSNIKEIGRQKVIDKISVTLNEKDDTYEASFFNLGINKVIVGSETIKKNPKLLVSGIWCIAEVEYYHVEDPKVVPWLLTSLKPIQMARSDVEGYKEGRKNFSMDEWIDFILQSMGLNPEVFSRRNKFIQLIRLIPFCERNYNLMELGPKGTGKSHIYSEFSPHGMLLSGGEVTVPKLFVNNSNGKIGLVGYWDCVAFDEFAGNQKKIDKALVDIMKNYMANKTFSRGTQTMGAEASMVFVGNTSHTVPYMLKTSDLFADLPDKYHDSAFLDRIHCFNPGWEVENLRSEMFSEGYGFVVDYFAEILRALRNDDYSSDFNQYFTLGEDISTRDKDGIKKTFSGLMKVIFPNHDATEDEIKELLTVAMEGRKRVKDQLLRIDSTFDKTNFVFFKTNEPTKEIPVQTLEEIEFADIYYGLEATKPSKQTHEQNGDTQGKQAMLTSSPEVTEKPLEEGHKEIKENQKGCSFNDLVQPYLKGAKKLSITDPYIRNFFQQRNLMEFLVSVVKINYPTEEIEVHLVTIQDEFKGDKQEENFLKMKDSLSRYGLIFTWEYDEAKTIHARHIETDTGWKISLDRGLDVYQNFGGDAFDVLTYLPELRACKAYEVTFIKLGK
ncbi:BREX system Lon protease-like protein BrxL [Succinivibrio faecicola]|uniref:BREX system Lon protease-like protein BrxL n=1 Tax=Succinivibrio faecicola TaxID=2820300 RepID=A0ABS7DI47_9GAMM|nr:BREX system Lon protease-like protein BrxL [Succinivibrio faecicola]MBW7570970.1 BREX system Lon protease-like protein BrxL [Succinivibrio faecicola]